MRAVIQRGLWAGVTLKTSGERREIGPGLLVLLGVAAGDTEADAHYLADKIVTLRVFEDAAGKMNQALSDLPHPAMLIVSQFTLLGDTRKSRRPSFSQAAPPAEAVLLYNHFIDRIRAQQVAVQTGEFGADMLVKVANDGPVTLIIESRQPLKTEH